MSAFIGRWLMVLAGLVVSGCVGWGIPESATDALSCGPQRTVCAAGDICVNDRCHAVCNSSADCSNCGLCSHGVCEVSECGNEDNSIPPDVCGDGEVGPSETCDDHNGLGLDGCSASCLAEVGWHCVGTGPSSCTSTCGDGHVRASEVCDDANTLGGDGCAADCSRIEVGWGCAGADPSICESNCADGLIRGTDQCDDNNYVASDGCDLCVLSPGWGCSGEPSTCMRVVYVSGGKASDGDGTSWAAARNNLQAAIDSASPGQALWVARGVYKPAPAGGDRTLSFVLRDAIPVYGGFDGTRNIGLTARNFQTDATVLSGDLNGNDNLPNGLIENSLHVVRTSASGVSLLDGVTITSGYADGSSYDDRGAGILQIAGALTLRNAVVRDNVATGDAAGVQATTITADHVIFQHNQAAASGGAARVNGNSSFRHCTFADNSAVEGGGLLVDVTGEVAIVGSIFERNIGTGAGSALRIFGSGSSAHLAVVNTIFRQHAAVPGSLVVADVNNNANLTIDWVNDLFVDNSFDQSTLMGLRAGGGGTNTLTANMVNTTVAGNSGGNIIVILGHDSEVITLNLVNSIIYGNDLGGGGMIGNAGSGSSFVVNATYSCLQSSWPGTGTITADPLLSSSYHLGAGSPAIDAGSNSIPQVTSDPYDLDGDLNTAEPLPMDFDLNGRFRGSGGASIIDMGAFEAAPL